MGYLKFILLVFLLAFMTGKVFGNNSDHACTAVKDIKYFHNNMWATRTTEDQNKLINCISEAWNFHDDRAKVLDAELRYYASVYLLAAFQYNPTNFVVNMDHTPKLFIRWLKYINTGVFVWGNEGPCDYLLQVNEIKKQLDDLNVHYRSNDTYLKMKEVFNNIECEMID